MVLASPKDADTSIPGQDAYLRASTRTERTGTGVGCASYTAVGDVPCRMTSLVELHRIHHLIVSRPSSASARIDTIALMDISLCALSPPKDLGLKCVD